MVEVVRQERKSAVLTPSSIPCLSGLPTINITRGCAHGCRYCYTQSYPDHPGCDRVVLFDNIPEMVRGELHRKKRRPKRIYFSPSSDPFQPLPEILDVTHSTMSLLLQGGVEVAFLTKGAVPGSCVGLFRHVRPSVFGQVGITTLDSDLALRLEPRAATPQQRLDNLRRLAEAGVHVSARLDPLVPEFTDTKENLIPLISALAAAGVKDIAASFLFLRPGMEAAMSGLLRAASRTDSDWRSWTWTRFADGTGGGRMPPVGQRRSRLARLRALAASKGMELRVCACKNPDIGRDSCRIAGPPDEAGTSAPVLPFPD